MKQKQTLKIAIVNTLLLQIYVYSLTGKSSILIIGDSNTENGYLSGSLHHFFDTTYCYTSKETGTLPEKPNIRKRA